jgi:hypothetical protein
MKMVGTGAARQSKNFSNRKLTIGLDLGDRSSVRVVIACLMKRVRAAGTEGGHDCEGDAVFTGM